MADACVANAAKGEIPLCNPDLARFDSTSRCRARCNATRVHYAYEQYGTNNTNCSGKYTSDPGWFNTDCYSVTDGTGGSGKVVCTDTLPHDNG